jgi:hypothetical protein
MDNNNSNEEQERVLKSHTTRFGAIGERIERKRQEIQGLSDGVSTLQSLLNIDNDCIQPTALLGFICN